MSLDSRRRYHRRKRMMVEYKGGECCICGYKKCLAALEFHHVKPEEKDFSLSDSYSMRWDRVVEELDKCILCCSNCHKEQHSTLDNYL